MLQCEKIVLISFCPHTHTTQSSSLCICADTNTLGPLIFSYYYFLKYEWRLDWVFSSLYVRVFCDVVAVSLFVLYHFVNKPSSIGEPTNERFLFASWKGKEKSFFGGYYVFIRIYPLGQLFFSTSGRHPHYQQNRISLFPPLFVFFKGLLLLLVFLLLLFGCITYSTCSGKQDELEFLPPHLPFV